MRGSDTITKVSGGTELRKSKALTCLVTILRTTHSVKFCRPEGLTEGKTPDSGRGPSVPVPVPESEATRQDDRYHSKNEYVEQKSIDRSKISGHMGTLFLLCMPSGSVAVASLPKHLLCVNASLEVPSSISSIAPKGSRRCTAGPSAYRTNVHTLECSWLSSPLIPRGSFLLM